MEDQPPSNDEDTNEDAVDPKFASNVLLFPKGAVFVFPRYAAGCYAEGEYYVTVSYSELTGVLNFDDTDLPAYILAMKPK